LRPSQIETPPVVKQIVSDAAIVFA